MKPMAGKVLVTGSSGMLGVDLCEELAEDHEVYGIDNRSRAGLNLPYNSAPVAQRYVKCDITDRRSVLNVLSKMRPDVVIHTAAWTDVDGCELDEEKAYEINSEGTENMALACEENGSVLLYLSTDFVFDGKKKTPYKETDKARPISVYGDSKFVGEETIQRIWPKHFILRTSWLYGRNGKNFVDTIIGKAAREKELKVVEDQVGSPTYSKDLAKAIHILLSKIMHRGSLPTGRGAGYGIYHVTNAGSVSWYEYAKAILRLAGSKTPVIPISSQELARPAKRPAMSVLDNSKFTGFTGYKMRPWSAALKDYIKKEENIYAKKT